MEENSTTTDADGTTLFAGEVWFDPIEAGIRERVRGFIEELVGQELEAAGVVQNPPFLGDTRRAETAGL